MIATSRLAEGGSVRRGEGWHPATRCSESRGVVSLSEGMSKVCPLLHQNTRDQGYSSCFAGSTAVWWRLLKEESRSRKGGPYSEEPGAAAAAPGSPTFPFRVLRLRLAGE